MEKTARSLDSLLCRLILVLTVISMQPLSVSQAGPGDDLQWMLQFDLSFGPNVSEYRFGFGVDPDLADWRPDQNNSVDSRVILPLLTYTSKSKNALSTAQNVEGQDASGTGTRSWSSEEVIWGVAVLIGAAVAVSELSDSLNQDYVGPVNIDYPELSPEALEPPPETAEE